MSGYDELRNSLRRVCDGRVEAESGHTRTQAIAKVLFDVITAIEKKEQAIEARETGDTLEGRKLKSAIAAINAARPGLLVRSIRWNGSEFTLEAS